jgi:hypothetical protein
MLTLGLVPTRAPLTALSFIGRSVSGNTIDRLIPRIISPSVSGNTIVSLIPPIISPILYKTPVMLQNAVHPLKELCMAKLTTDHKTVDDDPPPPLVSSNLNATSSTLDTMTTTGTMLVKATKHTWSRRPSFTSFSMSELSSDHGEDLVIFVCLSIFLGGDLKATSVIARHEDRALDNDGGDFLPSLLLTILEK